MLYMVVEHFMNQDPLPVYHSHKPSVEEHRGVLYVNPGSAGPRRFTLPVSLAHLHVTGDKVIASYIIELSV